LLLDNNILRNTGNRNVACVFFLVFHFVITAYGNIFLLAWVFNRKQVEKGFGLWSSVYGHKPISQFVHTGHGSILEICAVIVVLW